MGLGTRAGWLRSASTMAGAATVFAIWTMGAGCNRPPVCAPDIGELPPATPLNGRALGHAHNDYAQDRPLKDALDLGYRSVEADVWLRDGEIIVSHWGLSSPGTLRGLYLDPLQARITDRGSVHGDGAVFTLWIDLKSQRDAFQDAVAELLLAYPMIAEAGPSPALRIIFTGNAKAKAALVDRMPPATVSRDSNDFAVDDSTGDDRWSAYALRWSSYVSWDGHDTMAPKEQQRLRCILHAAHARGRQVRFFATPETENFWRFARSEGFDFVNTDALGDLRAAWAEPPTVAQRR